MLTRAEGLHVWDQDGRKYLDATSGAFCAQLGYSREDLVEAAASSARRIPHARPSIAESAETRAYTKELLAAAGAPYVRAVLTSSGSEAVDVALKVAHLYQAAIGRAERRRVVRVSGHVHGQTLGALAVTGSAARRAPYERILGEGLPSPAAFCRRCFRALTFPSCAIACAEAPMIENGSDPPAAWILETVPAAGLGAPVPPGGYLERVRAGCDRSGALWIADEVLTGFCRTGPLFAWRRLLESSDPASAPDLVVFGKGAGAGYAPLAGVLVSGRVESALSRQGFTHVQTYGGNPVASSVGRRVLRALEEEGIEDRVLTEERAFRDALEPLRADPFVFDVRGLGFLWGIELARDGSRGTPFPSPARAARHVAEACRERGILVHAGTGTVGGSSGDFILIAPPLVSGREAFTEIARALRDSIRALAEKDLETGCGR